MTIKAVGSITESDIVKSWKRAGMDFMLYNENVEAYADYVNVLGKSSF